MSNILRSFFESGKYDKRVRPNYGGTPVDVGITMQIISISTVSEVQMVSSTSSSSSSSQLVVSSFRLVNV